jgi:hypothetical protein
VRGIQFRFAVWQIAGQYCEAGGYSQQFVIFGIISVYLRNAYFKFRESVLFFGFLEDFFKTEIFFRVSSKFSETEIFSKIFLYNCLRLLYPPRFFSSSSDMTFWFILKSIQFFSPFHNNSCQQGTQLLLVIAVDWPNIYDSPFEK